MKKVAIVTSGDYQDLKNKINDQLYELNIKGVSNIKLHFQAQRTGCSCLIEYEIKKLKR